VDRLEDRASISAVVTRYATGVDGRQWDLYATCFTDPCEFDFSSWSGRPAASMPVAIWVAAVRSTLSGFDATQHLSTNHVIEFDGADRAICVSQMHAQHWMSPETLGSDQPDHCVLGGHYTNTFLRTGAVSGNPWQIARCQLTVTWWLGNRALFDLARTRAN
jgi:SnoaL-like domain